MSFWDRFDWVAFALAWAILFLVMAFTAPWLLLLLVAVFAAIFVVATAWSFGAWIVRALRGKKETAA